MHKEVVRICGETSIVIMDSITKATAEDTDAVVVSASHGGVSSGEFALAHPLGLVIFNDAGVGKDHAGTAALTMLEAHNRPAATVAHTSARIGDSLDHWQCGVISHCNAVAAAAGVTEGSTVQAAAESWAKWVQGQRR